MSDFEPQQPTTSTPSPYNHYGITGEQKNDSDSYQNWTGWGFGAGNRKADTPQADENDPNKAPEVKNATMGAPSVDTVDLSKLKVPEDQQGPKNGFYDESVAGVLPWETEGPSAKGKAGEGLGLDLWSGSAVAGARRQAGLRGEAEAKNQYGDSATASGDIYANAEAGAGVKAGLTDKGFEASANASAKAGVGINGDADLKSRDLRSQSMIDAGVSDPLTVGAGVHADGWAGAKVGAGLKAGLSTDFIGVEGKAGAMAGLEGNIDAHANLGPLKGKVGASGILGIGAEASGGISIEDWKIHIGGKVGAALGIGGSVSFDATLDLKQTYELAKWAGVQIHKGLDRDGDGKLGLNDAAKGVGELAQGGANMLDRGWEGAKNFLDGDGNGKFSMGDVKIRANQAKDWLANKAGLAKDWAGDQLDAAGKALHNMADRDGDGKIGMSDLVVGATQAKEFAKEKIGQAGQALGNAKDWAVDKAKQAGQWAKKTADRDGDGALGIGDVLTGIGEVKDFAGQKIGQAGKALGAAKDWAVDKAGDAKDWLLDKAKDAGKSLKKAADRDGDGQVGFSDLVTGFGQAKEWAGEKVGQAGQALGNAKDWALDKAGAAKDWLGGKAKEAGQALHNAADRDGDGQIGFGDVIAGAGQAKQWAGDKIGQAGKALGSAKDWAIDKGKAVKDAAFKAADQDGDGKLGLGDIKAGASNAKQWAGEKIGQAGKALGAAKDWAGDKISGAWGGIKNAGSTLASGLGGAAKTVGKTVGKVKDFFGGW
ncbi:MAG: hypothetical protein JNM83_09655 [Myxococcales bacterium]|nr:hypothetical protein [Myxococcales bacterium]